MNKKLHIPQVKIDQFGRVKAPAEDITTFAHILGNKISDILSFENGTDELLEQGRIILPRHYYIFEGMKDGEQQYKPYEYDRYRIFVSTYKGVIINVESVG